MSLPNNNEGFGIIPNRGGKKSASLSELQTGLGLTLYPNDTSSFNLLTLAENTLVSLGQTGAGGNGTWPTLDAYPANCAVFIQGVASMEGDGLSSPQQFSLFTGPSSGIFPLLQFSSDFGTSTATITQNLSGFAPMINGLLFFLYDFVDVSGANQILSIQTMLCVTPSNSFPLE